MYTIGFYKDGRFYPQTDFFLRDYIKECYEIPDEYDRVPLIGFYRREHAFGLFLQWALEQYLGNFTGNGHRDSTLDGSVRTPHDVLERLNAIAKDGFFTDYRGRRWCIRECEWPKRGEPFVMIDESNDAYCCENEWENLDDEESDA